MFRRYKKSSLWLELAYHRVALTFWLQAATDGLVDPARERIHAEIEGHYSEAVAAHMADGLAETEARTAAILELGDAEAASKRFRRQHLTARDAGEVEEALKLAGSRKHLLFSCLYYFLCTCWLFYIGKPDRRSFMVCLAVGFFAAVIAPAASYIMVKRKSKNMGFFILTEAVALTVFLFYLCYCWYGLSGDFIYFFCFFVLTLLPGQRLRIWLKLRHVANVWDEIPMRNE
jgi:hypothetical protein